MIHGRYTTCVSFLVLIFSSIQVQSQFQFTEISAEAGIDYHYLGVNDMGGGAAFFDMDNDGDEDLWVSGGLNRDVLYENDGTGKFTEIGFEAGLGVTFNLVTTGVITGDLDNDGYKDVLLTTQRGFSHLLLRNKGDKTFENLTHSAGLGGIEAYGLAASMADINLDGLLDIYIGNYIEKDQVLRTADRDTVLGFAHECHTNQLYLNMGDWTFQEVSEAWGVGDAGCALATAFSDFDGDHDPDLLVANDFGEWVLPNALFRNQYPEPQFMNISRTSGMDLGIYGMGIALGDYDQDLDLDYYITNLGANVLMENNTDGTFSEVAAEAGIADTYGLDSLLAVGWGTVFMDMDNDADLDVYVVNGYVPAAHFIDNKQENPNKFFENVGKGKFQEVRLEGDLSSPQRGRGLACADIDGDGDLDFLVANTTRQASTQDIHQLELYRNESSFGNNWLDIQFIGRQANRDGIGSKVYAYCGEKTYLYEASGGYGTHASQHSSILHMGLGESIVDSLVLFWPGGKKQLIESPVLNQRLTIQEEEVLTTNEPRLEQNFTSLQVFPNPFHQKIHIRFTLELEASVELQIFDKLGRAYSTSFPTSFGTGIHHLTWEAPHAGTYFLRLQSNHNFFYKTLISH
ncbi:MAG: FG-GAP-like repeat-containing protein [Bacteroidota bacterium]